MSISNVSSHIEPRVRAIRRVVTGHDAHGHSVVISDGACPHVECILGIPTLASTELWATHESPASNVGSTDPVTLPLVVSPPSAGSYFRVVEFPPDSDWKYSLGGHASLDGTTGSDSFHNPMMHRTRSLDYVVVISGEIWSVLDEGEVALNAGDVMVQRGTNHAWANRSDQPCLVAFVLMDAAPISGLDAH